VQVLHCVFYGPRPAGILKYPDRQTDYVCAPADERESGGEGARLGRRAQACFAYSTAMNLGCSILILDWTSDYCFASLCICIRNFPIV